jgi:hypothetical protein
MPKPRKDVNYNARSQVICDYFERSMRLREDQKGGSALISALNKDMASDGVDPGVLSIMRRIACLPEGKRGVTVANMRFYLDVLEEQLSDSQVDIIDLIRKAKRREMESVAPAPVHSSGNGNAARPAETKKSGGGNVKAKTESRVVPAFFGDDWEKADPPDAA